MDQIGDREWTPPELADRKRRASDRTWRIDCRHARTIRQPRIEYRKQFRNIPAQQPRDVLDRDVQVLRTDGNVRNLGERAQSLDEYPTRGIDHDFGDIVIGKETLDRSKKRQDQIEAHSRPLRKCSKYETVGSR